MSSPGRPIVKFEINFNRPLASLDKIKNICSNPSIKSNVENFAKALLNHVGDYESKSCQTVIDSSSMLDMIGERDTKENVINAISEQTKNMASYEKSFLLSIIWKQIHEIDQVKLSLMFYNELSFEGQCDLFTLLGKELNEVLYNASKQSQISSTELNLENLKKSSKSDFYNSCDDRLKSFIDSITDRPHSSFDNINWKSNIYENFLKARNKLFNSAVGIKEHMVSYLDSGKSRHTSQVFSRQGGKSTRPVLEDILKQSEEICQFREPVGSTLFFSFDNIQTLLKSHRIGGEHQKKALAIVVTSILSQMPDGDLKKSKIQYKTENCPGNWLYQYQYNAENKCLSQKIDTSVLKSCLAFNEEDHKLFEEYFEKELEDAIEFVKNDMEDDLQDSVDRKAKAIS